MNISYDKESHGLYIRLADGKYDESEELAPGIVFDFDADGRPLAIELEDIRGFIDEKSLRAIIEPHINRGADLREYRERLGMTQEALGELLGIPKNTIARWERDELAIEKGRVLELALTALVSARNSDVHHRPIEQPATASTSKRGLARTQRLIPTNRRADINQRYVALKTSKSSKVAARSSTSGRFVDAKDNQAKHKDRHHTKKR